MEISKVEHLALLMEIASMEFGTGLMKVRELYRISSVMMLLLLAKMLVRMLRQGKEPKTARMMVLVKVRKKVRELHYFLQGLMW